MLSLVSLQTSRVSSRLFCGEIVSACSGLGKPGNWMEPYFISECVCFLGMSFLYGSLLWCYLKGEVIVLEMVLLTGYKLTSKTVLLSSSCFQINLTAC